MRVIVKSIILGLMISVTAICFGLSPFNDPLFVKYNELAVSIGISKPLRPPMKSVGVVPAMKGAEKLEVSEWINKSVEQFHNESDVCGISILPRGAWTSCDFQRGGRPTSYTHFENESALFETVKSLSNAKVNFTFMGYTVDGFGPFRDTTDGIILLLMTLFGSYFIMAFVCSLTFFTVQHLLASRNSKSGI